MNEEAIRYEIIDNKGVIFSMSDYDEIMEHWKDIQDGTDSNELVGEVKLVAVLGYQ